MKVAYYDYISPKIHAIVSHIYTIDKLKGILSLSIQDFLKEVSIEETEDMSSRFLEVILYRAFISLIKKIARPLKEYKDFVNIMLEEFEISDIKYILSTKNKGKEINLSELISPVNISYRELVDTEDINKAIEYLKDSYYREAFKDKKNSLKNIFANIDILHLKQIDKYISTFDTQTGTQVARFFRMYKLMKTTTIAFRLHFNYNIEYENSDSIIFYNELKKNDIKRIFNADDITDIYNILPDKIKDIIDKELGLSDFPTKQDISGDFSNEKLANIELIFDRYLGKLAKKMFYGNIFTFAEFLGFYFIKRNEIKNILTAYNGIRLNIEQDQILRYMI